jgi:hypothetical protein
MLLRVSLDVADESDAVTVRPSAETIPCVTVGVPAASPRALPMATTASPTTRVVELPNVTLGRPEMLSILMRAMSFAGSVPISVAERGVSPPVRVTVMSPPVMAAEIT